jgi:hypothetical protein
VELEKRIAHLKQTISGLMVLCNSPLTPDSENNRPSVPRFAGSTLTSALRRLLAESPSPITPPQLRDALAHNGLGRYTNKLAAIHNTLARLEKQGEAIRVLGGWAITEKGQLAVQIDSLDPRTID